MIQKSVFFNFVILFWFSFTSFGFFFFFKLGFSVYFENLHWFARKTGEKQRENQRKKKRRVKSKVTADESLNVCLITKMPLKTEVMFGNSFCFLFSKTCF